jgi:antitoxin component of MazEF toxin-antitoxin module
LKPGDRTLANRSLHQVGWMDNLDHSVRLQVSPEGEVHLPSEYLRSIGVADGGPVVVSVKDGEIRIRSLEAMLRRLDELGQKAFAGSGYTVDQFLAERRADWGEDDA